MHNTVAHLFYCRTPTGAAGIQEVTDSTVCLLYDKRQKLKVYNDV